MKAKHVDFLGRLLIANRLHSRAEILPSRESTTEFPEGQIRHSRGQNAASNGFQARDVGYSRRIGTCIRYMHQLEKQLK